MRQVAAKAWLSGGGGGLGRPLGHVLALVAVLCQLLAAALLPVPGDAAVPGDLLRAGVICHADAGAPPRPDHAPIHPSAECALCPLCLAAAPPVLVPVPPSIPPQPVQDLAATLPPARANPFVAGHRLAAQPRGPPAPA